MSPIAYPISLVLDCVLGRDIGTVYSQEEFKRLMCARHCPWALHQWLYDSTPVRTPVDLHRELSHLGP